MLVLIPFLLILLALMVGAATASDVTFGIYLKDLRNPYYRLGIFYEPLDEYINTKTQEIYQSSQLTIGLLIINVIVTFYTPKGNDTTVESSNTTILS